MPYGQDVGIAIGFQPAWGTQVDVGSLFQIPFLSEDVGLTQEDLISENLRGLFDEGDSYSGQREYGGSIEAEAQPIALGAMITAVVNDPVSVSSDDLRTYTWNPRTTDFDSNVPNRPLSYYKHLKESSSVSAQLFYDLAGSQLEFQLSAGGFFVVRNTYVGGKTATVASQALVLDSGRRWPWNQASIQLAASAVADFTDFTITHNEGLEARWTLDGALVANRIKRASARTLRIAGTVIFESQTELNNFKNEATQQLIITLESAGTEISSGYNNHLTIDIPQFKWIDYKPVVQGTGEIEVNFTGKAEYHTGSASMVQYTLVSTFQTGYTP